MCFDFSKERGLIAPIYSVDLEGLTGSQDQCMPHGVFWGKTSLEQTGTACSLSMLVAKRRGDSNYCPRTPCHYNIICLQRGGSAMLTQKTWPQYVVRHKRFEYQLAHTGIQEACCGFTPARAYSDANQSCRLRRNRPIGAPRGRWCPSRGPTREDFCLPLPSP